LNSGWYFGGALKQPQAVRLANWNAVRLEF